MVRQKARLVREILASPPGFRVALKSRSTSSTGARSTGPRPEVDQTKGSSTM